MSDNINNAGVQHGGNLSVIAAEFPDAPRPYIDLSTGINPYPYQLREIAGANNRLADVAEMAAAHEAAAEYYGTNAQNITLAAGMQPLMFALAALRYQKFGVGKTHIFAPTYSEYATIWTAAGHVLTDDIEAADIVIICNPNNPDGRIIPKAELLQIADNLAARNGWLIVDEAFADLTPEISVVGAVSSRHNVIIMRSMGKFFGLAGLRVSAAIAPREINSYLRVVAGAWAISTNSCLQLPAIFADRNWAAATRSRLATESAAWREILAQKFTIIGHTPLFTLVESADADYCYNHLAKSGILTRKFVYNPYWLRFGLPNVRDIECIASRFL